MHLLVQQGSSWDNSPWIIPLFRHRTTPMMMTRRMMTPMRISIQEPPRGVVRTTLVVTKMYDMASSAV